ncbi:unnamed protein product, partial [marine sediment metagenome]
GRVNLDLKNSLIKKDNFSQNYGRGKTTSPRRSPGGR